jgi:hypothetical protein
MSWPKRAYWGTEFVNTGAPIRWRAVRFAVVALVALGIGAVGYTIATTVPTRHSLYPKCPTHLLTGLHCPGCGTGRATHLLLNGHPLDALRCNAFAPFFGPYLTFVLLSFLLRWALHVPPQNRRPVRAFWIWLLAAALIIYTVARNIPAEPFSYLAPREFEAPTQP